MSVFECVCVVVVVSALNTVDVNGQLILRIISYTRANVVFREKKWNFPDKSTCISRTRLTQTFSAYRFHTDAVGLFHAYHPSTSIEAPTLLIFKVQTSSTSLLSSQRPVDWSMWIASDTTFSNASVAVIDSVFVKLDDRRTNVPMLAFA